MLNWMFNNLMGQQLQAGFALFNAGRFFDAHEVLEDAWRNAPRHGARRRHLQGLVQAAVALHHHSTSNIVGARSVLRRACRNLEGAEESLPDLDLAALRASLADWQEYLDELNSAAGREPKCPSLPVIVVRAPK